MTVGLVMIARDAAAGIVRALDSARPWVDDLLVLDTGSLDDTPGLARRAGARVAAFDWIDDFSAARNAALALSPTDWHLVLDADEWIAGGAQALTAAVAGPACFVGLVPVDSAFDSPQGVQHSASLLPRLLPRGTRYAGRIHEQPQSALERREVGLRIGHDGYRDAALRAKDGRNRRLLDLALAEAPDDAYLLYQLGKDHEVHERYAGAVVPYRRALERAPRDARWRHDLVVRSVHTFKRIGAHAEAVALADAELQRWPTSPDFFFAIGDLMLDWAASEPARSAELLPMAEAAWQRCLEIGENLSHEGAVPGRGSHLAAHNLALLGAFAATV